MAIVLLLDHHPNLISKLNDYLLTKYNISNASISTRFIRDLPRDENGYCISHLKQRCITDYYPLKDVAEYIDDITDISLIGDVIASDYIKPQITWTDDLAIAQQWLPAIEATYPQISVDFETLDLTLPQLNQVTMVTLGWSFTKSIVIILDKPELLDYVMNWLVTIDNKQTYHNSLFDVRFILNHTGKLPKHIEDSQLLVAVYKNHVDESKRKSGLKELAKYPYKDWASDKSSFELYINSESYINPNLHYVGSNPTPWIYNLPLVYYCGVDSCASTFVWTKYDIEPAYPDHWIFQTSEPRYNSEQFNQRYYYDFILKPAIPVIAEMMMNGQAIDLSQVQAILDTVTKLNDECKSIINDCPMVQAFHKQVDQARIDKFLEPVLKAWKHPDYSKGYQSNPKMRAYVVNHMIGTEFDTLSDKQLKDLANPLLQPLIDKQFDHPDIVAACNAYHEAEALRQNTNMNRVDKINNPQNYVQIGYNPFNYSQLTDMWMSFGLESPEVSKDTGKMSFSKDVLTELSYSVDGELKTILKNHLEISQSKNMITQYIPKYYGSTVNGRLHYSLKLMGTFTGRLSGKAGGDKLDESIKHKLGANGVTQPVGHRVYGKLVKKMFIAPPGRIMAAVDYNGLENHINACLTKDNTTIKLLSPDPETGLMWDMHTLHSTIFFKEKWEQISNQPFENTIQYNQLCYALTDTNSEAKQLRTDSKPITFKCAYGGYPDSHKGGVITQAIFDRYHEELYPGVNKFKTEYVIPTVNSNKSLHLNWGLRLATDNPRGDLLPLNNANFQGYSDLTCIAAVKFRNLYLSQGNPHNVMGLNIIHDALYYELDDTPEAVEWVNTNLIACMTPDFLINQTVHLRAECDFGYNQKDMVTMPNNADLATIIDKLSTLK